ncbi:MAG: SpoIIE family protein phosphatase [Alteraurantiacibacter sp.]
MIGWLKIQEASAVAEARRRARRTASAMGLNSIKVEHVAIVATEIAQNVRRHGGGGKMLIEVFGAPSLERLQIVGYDEGPGMDRIDRMMRDGETTSTSFGTGLGAIKRLSDSLDIFSEPGGTVVVAEFRKQHVSSDNCDDHGGFKLAYPGERRCGDVIAVRSGNDKCLYLLGDGLGHGVKASHAAVLAREAFLKGTGSDPAEILGQIGTALENSRGAVGAVIAVDRSGRTLHYAGIGNISTLVVQGRKVRRMPVRDGLLGGRAASPHEEMVELEQNAVIIMHSDGLNTLRSLESKIALFQRSGAVIASSLLAKNLRGRDDASIIAVRMAPARSVS